MRCERASAFLREKGVDNVVQLEGGIHRYLEAYEKDGGIWKVRQTANYLACSRSSAAMATASVLLTTGTPSCWQLAEPRTRDCCWLPNKCCQTSVGSLQSLETAAGCQTSHQQQSSRLPSRLLTRTASHPISHSDQPS